MKAGIICEGPSDAAVITNILKATLDIDGSDISYLVPELEYDETDISQMPKERFSTWTIVKQSCEDKTKIDDFLNLFEGDRFIIIHLDSDMRLEIGYEVLTPQQVDTKEDITILHHNISARIQEWLKEEEPSEQIVLAIAVQAIDAWVLTIYDSKNAETGILPNTKKRLFDHINKSFSDKDKKKIFKFENNKFNQYKTLSNEFRKRKNLNAFVERNQSLKLFFETLIAKGS